MVEELKSILKEKYPALYIDFRDAGYFEDDELFLESIELYKIVSREELINMFNNYGKPYVNCKASETSKGIEDRLDKIKDSGLFVYKVNDLLKSMTVVRSVYSNANENCSIYFSEYSFNVMYVTPLNYKILAGGEDILYSMYNPIMLYKRIVYDAIENHVSDIHITNYLTSDLDDSDELRSKGSKYRYEIAYRKLNDYIPQNLFKLNKELNNNLVETIVRERTSGFSVDLTAVEGVKTSWLNPIYDGETTLRITCSSTGGGYTMVTRISRIASLTAEIEYLGFNDKVNKALKRLSAKEYGVTFVTGPVRAGKNTTVNAMVNQIIKKPLKLKEFSSPIEIRQPFEQLDYNDDRRTLDAFIDLVKKQDVDMAVINELPKKEVAEAVLDLVNSSIGVLTTFHIDRIWDFPYKLKDYFGKSYIDLITKINGVINQKMFVLQCPYCQVKEFDETLPAYILDKLKEHDISVYKKSKGCPRCRGTGKSDRVQPFAEFLIFDRDIKSKLLRCEKTYEMEDVIKDAVESNHNSLEDFIVEAIRDGKLHPLDLEKIL